jgi:hypothetical protein
MQAISHSSFPRTRESSAWNRRRSTWIALAGMTGKSIQHIPPAALGGQSPVVRRGARKAVTFVIALFVAACSAPDAPSRPVRSPKIVFQSATHDFGHVTQGTTVTHIYSFRNTGGLNLTIDNVRAACGCTAVVTPHRVVPAGTEGTIEAAFDTSDAFGPMTRTVIVYSNDPAQPVTALTLSGYVDAEVAADPPQLYVGHLGRGQAAVNDVRLMGTSFPPGAVVSHNGNVLKTDLQEGAPGTGKRLRVAIQDDAPFGQFKEVVSIGTTSRRRPVLTIPVTGTVDRDTGTSPTVENAR